MAVRTKLLAVGETTISAFETVYTVPAGHTAILKSVFLVTHGTTPITGEVFGQIGSGPILRLVVAQLQQNQPQVLERWIVFPAGYRILIAASPAGHMGYWISGTELLGEPEVPTVPTVVGTVPAPPVPGF